MNLRNFFMLAVVSGTVVGLGCGSTPSSASNRDEGPVGTAQFAVKIVPNDVQCIQVTAVGSRTLTTSFSVAPNQAAQLSMPGLPAGSVTFSASAYSVPCSQVTAASIPGWSSAPVTATVVAAGTIQVTLAMSQSGTASIGIDFGGSSGTGGATGTAGAGGTSSLAPGVWDSSSWDKALWQ